MDDNASCIKVSYSISLTYDLEHTYSLASCPEQKRMYLGAYTPSRTHSSIYYYYQLVHILVQYYAFMYSIQRGMLLLDLNVINIACTSCSMASAGPCIHICMIVFMHVMQHAREAQARRTLSQTQRSDSQSESERLGAYIVIHTIIVVTMKTTVPCQFVALPYHHYRKLLYHLSFVGKRVGAKDPDEGESYRSWIVHSICCLGRVEEHEMMYSLCPKRECDFYFLRQIVFKKYQYLWY